MCPGDFEYEGQAITRLIARVEKLDFLVSPTHVGE